MPISKRPKLVRSIAYAKLWIEHRLGVSLADALNLSLFILTIASLFIAGIGVGVAWITYTDAKRGGEAQERELKKSADSLEGARGALAEQESRLNKISDQLGESAKVQALQESALRDSLGVANGQLATLKTQSALLADTAQQARQQLDISKEQIRIAMRSPHINLRVDCAPGFDILSVVFGLTQSHVVTGPDLLVLNDRALDFKASSRDLKDWINPDEKGLIGCLVVLINTGDSNLTNGYVRVRIAMNKDLTDLETLACHSAPPNISRESASGMFGYRVDEVDSSLDPTGEDSEFTSVDNAFISIMSNRVVYPSTSVDVFPFNSAGLNAAVIFLKLPVETTHVISRWEFGGDQQNVEGLFTTLHIRTDCAKRWGQVNNKMTLGGNTPQ